MKSLSKILVFAVAGFVGSFMDRAAAQTGGGATAPDPAVPNRLTQMRAQAERRTPGSNAVFNFSGGTPAAFITNVESQFKVDWAGIATIPREMENVQIPKLRVPTEHPEDLLKLYNRLGQENPTLGKWVWEGNPTALSVLMLVPANKTLAVSNLPEPAAQVRIFQLKWISGTNLATLAEAVTLADEAAQQTARKEGRKRLAGRVVIDERTGSLIVSGSPDSMPVIQSLIERMDIPTYPPSGETVKKVPGGFPGQSTPVRGQQ